ncbi:MAG: flavodoxin family protein [Ruminococcaceae bacterium]|nr:flavodoxin family protein [Oscillospiraceae bacterium]
MSDILCMYYSRTGNTRMAVKEIAAALDAEVVRITDGVDYNGWGGYVRAGMEAMRRSTHSLKPYSTEKELSEYRLVILGTPVWAGRCCAPIRGFLKRRGLELERVAYVLTRGGDRRCEEIFSQMDQYTAQKHLLDVSLRTDSVGYAFWRDKFIQDVKRYMEQ